MEQWPALVVVGANHRSAPLALRERLMVEDEDIGALFSRLKDAGVSQALLLSTCDRVEVHTIHADSAAAALDVTRDIHGDLGPCAGLLIGLGEMGEMVARRLIAGGLGRLAVTHRTATRAAAMARALDANVIAYEALDQALAHADVIVTCAGLGGYTLGAKALEAALKARRRRPIFVIDLAAPNDADPAIEDLDGAFLYDSDDLEGVARAGIAQREAAAEDAWAIVDEALAAYHRDRTERAGASGNEALHRRMAALRKDILAETGGDEAEAERMMRHLLSNDEETEP